MKKYIVGVALFALGVLATSVAISFMDGMDEAWGDPAPVKAEEPVDYTGEWVTTESSKYLIVSPPNTEVGDNLHGAHAHIMKRTMNWGFTIEDLGDGLLIAHTKGHVHGRDGDHAEDINSIAFGVISGQAKGAGIHFIVQATVGERGAPGARDHSPEIHLYAHNGELHGWFMGPEASGQLHLKRAEIAAAP